MNLQLFIVIIIGIIVGVLLIREIYRFFFVKKDYSRCGSCNMCDLPKQQQNCRKVPTEP